VRGEGVESKLNCNFFALAKLGKMRESSAFVLSDSMARQLTCIDLFAGAGGLSLGLKAASFLTVAAVERDADAVDTFSKNVGADCIFKHDIREINFKRFKGIDLVAGGPPCQPFSTGGLRKGRNDDRDMLAEFVRVVLEVEPQAFLMENVPGLASSTHGEYLREVLSPLFERFHIAEPMVLNASRYGAPQNRKRMVVVGLADREFKMAPGNDRIVPAGDVLGPKPLGEPNETKVIYAKNPDLRPNPYHGQLFNGGGRAIDLDRPAPTMLASAGGNKTHFLDIGKHVPPYHTHLLGGGKPKFGELPDARRLTVAECAALQTFPTEMKFSGSRSSQYKQIGNAVPVKLAAIVGQCLAEQMISRQRQSVIL
jgi:DNA (cytosine-5)-methyltransferase 1